MRLTFMGTAGARFMVAKQVAASGGLFLEDGQTRILRGGLHETAQVSGVEQLDHGDGLRV